MTIATMMAMIAIVEIVFCRSMTFACSDWSLAASVSPAAAAWVRTGVQVVTIILAACSWFVRAVWPIFSASASQSSTSATKLFSSALSSRG